MSDQRPFHRYFGLTWIDFFQGSAIEVETEMDLSLKQQFVDLVLIHKGSGAVPRPLPDGFEDLAAHNVLTFKSYQEALDDWAILELLAHFVNYRKQASPSRQEMLPRPDFRLFAVCARYPHNLAQQVTLTRLRPGVYDLPVVTLSIRVIVMNQLPPEEQNAMLHLFSANEELLRYGKEHYRPRSKETSTLLYQLFKAYQEDPDMSKQLEEFVRQSIDELLATLPPEELRKRLTEEERLEGLSAEKRLEGLSPEKRLEGLSAEKRLEGLSAEEVVKALSPETLEALARQLKANGPSTKPE